MGYFILGGIAAICAGGWFLTRLSWHITIYYYVIKKGYEPPTRTVSKL